MKVVAAFPRPVRRIEHCWIPLPDGCRLAARVWLPEDAETSPVPAIVEYIPYRKRDFTRARDEPMHHYFAGHGYAAVRVDVRGSGESDGVLLDEYAEQELADGVAVIDWIAARSWCTGSVGMIGKSWGGINVLEIAARRPPALRAIITVCGSDDRYADDAHYMGGCLLNENLTWGSMLLTSSALPPDPALVGERWRALWLARLDHAVLFPEVWLRHQRRDAYWRRADLERITCAVYAVGGWADAYTNAIPRLLAGLTAPRKGLIGPWAHVYPHGGSPGPAIGFLQEALRWWAMAADGWRKRPGRRRASCRSALRSVRAGCWRRRAVRKPRSRGGRRSRSGSPPATGAPSAAATTLPRTSETTMADRSPSTRRPSASASRFSALRLPTSSWPSTGPRPSSPSA